MTLHLQLCFLASYPFRFSTVMSGYPPGKQKSHFRVFLPFPLPSTPTITLPPSELSHLRARRVPNGTTLHLFNADGQSATAYLHEDYAHIHSIHDRQPTSTFTAIIGLPKSFTRSDMIIEKLTELGITHIIWVVSERSIIKNAIKNTKIQRWERIAISAAKQSLRDYIPKIEIKPLDQVVKNIKHYDCALLLSPQGRRMLCKETIEKVKKAHNTTFIIGPEGGFSHSEEELLVSAGAERACLGEARLRVETAAIAAAVVIMQMYDGDN